MYSDYYNIYNGYYRNNKQIEFNSGEIITFNQALELIKQSVKNEKEDEIFYNFLIKQAPTNKEKDIIKNISEDEQKHNKILRKLYYEFTGEFLPQENLVDNIKTNMDYKSNLEKSLFGELDAVAKYRKILGAMPSGNSYTLLMSIMTDELRHAIKYNFLIQNA